MTFEQICNVCLGIWEVTIPGSENSQYQSGIMPTAFEKQQEGQFRGEGVCWKLVGNEFREIRGTRSYRAFEAIVDFGIYFT